MLDFENYSRTRERLGTPLYVEENSPALSQIGPFYDDEGNETVGSKVGRWLAIVLAAAFIFYLWAH